MSALSATERLRRRYTPSPVRALFVGESPPSGPTFFYDGNSKLFWATQEGFGRALPRLAELEPLAFLEAFKTMGCYLEDLCAEPVNHLSMRDPVQRKLRERARSDGILPLAARIRRYRPTVIMVVMKNVQADVVAAADWADSAGAVLPALPFPNWPAATAKYKSQLEALVGHWVNAGVVAAPHG